MRKKQPPRSRLSLYLMGVIIYGIIKANESGQIEKEDLAITYKKEEPRTNGSYKELTTEPSPNKSRELFLLSLFCEKFPLPSNYEAYAKKCQNFESGSFAKEDAVVNLNTGSEAAVGTHHRYGKPQTNYHKKINWELDYLLSFKKGKQFSTSSPEERNEIYTGHTSSTDDNAIVKSKGMNICWEVFCELMQATKMATPYQNSRKKRSTMVEKEDGIITKSGLKIASPISPRKSGRHHYKVVAQTKKHGPRMKARGRGRVRPNRDDILLDQRNNGRESATQSYENLNEENSHYNRNSFVSPPSVISKTIAPDVLIETSIRVTQNSRNYTFREFKDRSTTASLTATTFSEYAERTLHGKVAESSKDLNAEKGTRKIDPLSKQEKILRFKQKYPVPEWKAAGLGFTDSYLESINSHWLEFDPPNPLTHILIACLYGVFMTVGSCGNAIVLLTFVCCKTLQTPPNFLIANLALSDFLMMLKTPIVIVNSYYGGPALGKWGCDVYGFVGGLSGTASIMTLAAIALDRYFVIVRPLSQMKQDKFQRVQQMIFAVWVYSVLCASLPFMLQRSYTSEGYLTSCSFDYLSDDPKSLAFIWTFFVAAYVVPISIITLSYVRIWCAVHEMGRLDTFGNGASSGESCRFVAGDTQRKKELKIAKLAAKLITFWVVSWTPYASIAIIGITGHKHLITPFWSATPAIFCKTASCINPFIYSINHPRVQKEIRTFCCSCCIGKRLSARQSSYNSAVTVRCENEAKEIPSVASTIEIEPASHATHHLTSIELNESKENLSFTNENSKKQNGTHELPGSLCEAIFRPFDPVRIFQTRRSRSCHFTAGRTRSHTEVQETGFMSIDAPIEVTKGSCNFQTITPSLIRYDFPSSDTNSNSFRFVETVDVHCKSPSSDE